MSGAIREELLEPLRRTLDWLASLRDARGRTTWGAGRHASIVRASLEAVTSAANRLQREDA